MDIPKTLSVNYNWGIVFAIKLSANIKTTSLTIEDINDAIINHLNNINRNVAFAFDPLGKCFCPISKSSDKLFKNRSMKRGLQIFSVVAPLLATACDESLAQEVVHESINEYFIRVFTGRQNLVDVLRFYGHKDWPHRYPNSNN